MPLPIIPKPPFPNVLQLPGVPQLTRTVASFYAKLRVTLGVQAAQSQLWASSKSSTTWGIFDSSGTRRVINPDNVLNFDNRNDWRVSDFPVEQGQFASYNKVILPPEYSVRFTKGGSLSDRTAFLQEIATVAGDLNKYVLVTPERSYPSINVLRYEITRRGSEGAYYFAEVDIFFREIVEVIPQYSNVSANTANAQQPAALPAVNQGLLQPVTLTDPGISASVTAALAGAPN